MHPIATIITNKETAKGSKAKSKLGWMLSNIKLKEHWNSVGKRHWALQT